MSNQKETRYVDVPGPGRIPERDKGRGPVLECTHLGIEFGGRYAVTRSFAVGAHLGYKLLQSNKVIRYDLANEPLLTETVVLHMLGGGLSLYFGN